MQQHSEKESTDPGRHDNTPRWADCTMSTRPDAGAYDAPAGSAGEASKGAKPAVFYISYLLSGKFMDVAAIKRKTRSLRHPLCCRLFSTIDPGLDGQRGTGIPAEQILTSGHPAVRGAIGRRQK
jgi:hypothetical protein